MKKDFLKVMIIMFLLFSTSVNASSYSSDEIYFINKNDIGFTEFQYNVLVDILSKEIVSNFTQEEYDNFHVENIIEGEYEYVTQEFFTRETSSTSGIMPLAYYETASKKLTLAKNCNSNYCAMNTTLTWKTTPVVTSYDVIGARLVNTTFYDDLNAITVTSRTGAVKTGCAGTTKTNKGVGNAIKIASDVYYITHSFRVNPASNGTVYASYQHAVNTMTLSKALNFTFSGSGYGSVFVWPLTYSSNYDKMGGVSLDLA